MVYWVFSGTLLFSAPHTRIPYDRIGLTSKLEANQKLSFTDWLGLQSRITSILGCKTCWMYCVLTGHFIENKSQRCVGLVGREVASERECTRDAEWKLLRLQLYDFGSAASSELLVERTGGDAMQLRAPIEARDKLRSCTPLLSNSL